MKRFFAIALVFAMIFAICPFGAFSAIADSFMGEYPENPMAKFDISVDGGYIPGETLTVTVTVKDVKFEKGLNVVHGTFVYDTEALALLNGSTSKGALDCITKAPGNEWFSENLCYVEDDGTITLATMGGTVEQNIYANDGDLVFTLNFAVSENTTGDLLFYISNTSNLVCVGDDDFATGYPMEGAYIWVYEVPAEDESSDIPSEDESYDEPSEDESYDEPSEDESYDEPSEDDSYDESSEDESYDEPSEDESYDEPSEDESFDDESSEDEPFDDSFMGEYPENPYAKFDISVDGNYIEGEMLTVSVTVKDVKFYNGLNAVLGTFVYDTEALTLLNSTASNGALDCVTKAPGNEWFQENFSKVNDDGTILLATMGGIAESNIYAKDGDLVFTLYFEVTDSTDDLLFYIPNDNISRCECLGDDDFSEFYPMEGAYHILKACSEHIFGAEADCENDQACTICGYVIQKAYGHQENRYVTAPTCTEDGYTLFVCVDCGNERIGDIVPASHSFETITVAPTCTAEGYTACVCEDCGYEDIINILPASHSYHSVVTAPTCSSQGYTTHTCLYCGNSYTDNYVRATGHTYVSVNVKPTCTMEGYTGYLCQTCGDVDKISTTDALGHTEGEWVTVSDERQELRCEACDEMLDYIITIYDTYDINHDGVIDVFDYYIVKSIVMCTVYDEVLSNRCDVNGDGRINMFDYVMVKSKYFGLR